MYGEEILGLIKLSGLVGESFVRMATIKMCVTADGISMIR